MPCFMAFLLFPPHADSPYSATFPSLNPGIPTSMATHWVSPSPFKRITYTPLNTNAPYLVQLSEELNISSISSNMASSHLLILPSVPHPYHHKVQSIILPGPRYPTHQPNSTVHPYHSPPLLSSVPPSKHTTSSSIWKMPSSPYPYSRLQALLIPFMSQHFSSFKHSSLKHPPLPCSQSAALILQSHLIPLIETKDNTQPSWEHDWLPSYSYTPGFSFTSQNFLKEPRNSCFIDSSYCKASNTYVTRAGYTIVTINGNWGTSSRLKPHLTTDWMHSSNPSSNPGKANHD